MAKKKDENPKIVCQRCKKETSVTKYTPDPVNKPDEVLQLCDECIIKGIKEPDQIQEKIVTKKSQKPKAKNNKAKDVETKPIDRVDIQKKIGSQEEDVDKLLGQRLRLQQQLGQTNDMIVAKRGAIAGLRDLLGDS